MEYDQQRTCHQDLLIAVYQAWHQSYSGAETGNSNLLTGLDDLACLLLPKDTAFCANSPRTHTVPFMHDVTGTLNKWTV
jgi:hypothetical protein